MKQYIEQIKFELLKFDSYEAEALLKILQEYSLAKQKHLDWPTDRIYGCAIITEELGELVQACNNASVGVYPSAEQVEHIDKKAAQVGATIIHFLFNHLRPF